MVAFQKMHHNASLFPAKNSQQNMSNRGLFEIATAGVFFSGSNGIQQEPQKAVGKLSADRQIQENEPGIWDLASPMSVDYGAYVKVW